VIFQHTKLKNQNRIEIYLTSESSGIAIQCLRAEKESAIALAPLALLVVKEALVATESSIGVAVIVVTVDWAIGSSSASGSITNTRIAHILHDDLAVGIVALAARVLVGPLDVHLTSSVIVHIANIVAAAVVVL
jgi:hypothetical protein